MAAVTSSIMLISRNTNAQTSPIGDHFWKVSSKSAQLFRRSSANRQTGTHTDRHTHTHTHTDTHTHTHTHTHTQTDNPVSPDPNDTIQSVNEND